jgi:EF-hand domain-containing protein 1
VLRFYGYFKEGVVESRLENYRIRKLVVMYYLEDHTLMINEPKETNSGTPQGVFLKRQMVIKGDGSNTPLLPTDFRIGLDVGLFGRTVRITDCDQYTREFFDVRYTLVVFLFTFLEHWTKSARCLGDSN